MKNITKRKEYQRIEKSIENNKANTKRLLQQREFKMFNCLKYKPNLTTEETPKPTKHKTGFQIKYASAVQGTNNFNTNVNITHKSNDTNADNESQTLLNKLKTLNPNKDRKAVENHHLEVLPKQETNQVQGTKKRKSEKWNMDFQTVSNQQHHQRQCKKRADGLHTGRPGHKKNTEIIDVLTFIRQTMETLSVYNYQLKAKLDINLTHQETL